MSDVPHRRPFDVVVLGDCGVDIYAGVERLPGHDEKVPGDFLGFHGGGVAANFACAAGRLGASTALLATVGEDWFGDLAKQSVAQFGVDVTGVVRVPDVATSFCFVALDAGGEKALTIVRTENFFPGWRHIREEFLVNTKWLHIAPFDLDVAARAASRARAAGVSVSLDLEPGMAGAGLRALEAVVSKATLVMPNQLLMHLLFGDDHDLGAQHLLNLGPEAVVVTRGAEGVYLKTRDGAFRVPAFPVRVRDTTGAGDCFNAALVSCLQAGAELEAAARFAAGAAALSITEVGARRGLPTREQVRAFVGRTSPRTG